MAKHFKDNSEPKSSGTTPVITRREWENQNSAVPLITTHASRTGAYVGLDRRKTKKKKNILSTVLLVVGLVLIIVAAGMFVFAQLQYKVQSDNNAKLAEYAEVDDSLDTGPEVDWAGLKAINDDVVGWIQIPYTNINFPVYQGTNNEEYLHTTAEGEYSLGGQVFMDYENTAPGLVDKQTLIYGHHLYDGSMFTYVDKMTEQDVFDEVTTIWYATEDAVYELEPLFIYKSEATNNDARKITFASDEEFRTYLTDLLAKASAQSDDAATAITKVSKVMTLATCDYNNDFGVGNGRCLLVCALKSEVAAE